MTSVVYGKTRGLEISVLIDNENVMSSVVYCKTRVLGTSVLINNDNVMTSVVYFKTRGLNRDVNTYHAGICFNEQKSVCVLNFLSF